MPKKNKMSKMVVKKTGAGFKKVGRGGGKKIIQKGY